MRTSNAFFASLAIAAVAGFLLAGSWLYLTPVGIDETGYPGGSAIYSVVSRFAPGVHGAIAGGVLVGLLVLALGGLAFWLVRGAARANVSRDRRSFLTGSLAGTGAAITTMGVAGGAAALRGLLGFGEGNDGWRPVTRGISAPGVEMTHPEWKQAWKGSRVKAYRRLGRTDFEISDIVLGSGPLKGDEGTEIASLAIERGINYIDTSPDYSANGSEEAVGRAIAGRRDGLFLATKFCTARGHLPPGTPVEKYKQALEASLTRLGTDYVDLVHIHACDQVDRLMDPNVHEAFDRLKEEGKVRFLGFSTHTPNLVEVANTAIDSGRFDVMMLAYHHGIWAPLAEIIARGRSEQDMGVVAMKTLKGAKHHGLAGFKDEANAYSQAALKWVLSSSDVSCAVISFRQLQHVDEYLAASGSPASTADVAILEEYDRQIFGSYCAPHCGECLDACPEQLPIADILRYRMYFEDYGQEKEAMRLYGALGADQRATQCAGCSAPCLGTCPVGVAIPERLAGAHDLLTLA